MKSYTCETCNKVFEPRSRSHIYRFCSHACYAKSLIGSKSQRKERIKRSGYWYVYLGSAISGTKQGYYPEHRLILEKHLGRKINKGEVIHHINRDVLDNRIENLQLFSSPGTHIRDGHPEVREKQKIIFKGKRFSPETEFKSRPKIGD